MFSAASSALKRYRLFANCGGTVRSEKMQSDVKPCVWSTRGSFKIGLLKLSVFQAVGNDGSLWAHYTKRHLILDMGNVLLYACRCHVVYWRFTQHVSRVQATLQSPS